MNTVNPQGPSADLSTVDDSQKKFIELWGDMGAKWGVPRSMTELHALLYIMGIPLNTDEIMKLLSISRGNVSMTLRTLLDWGIITRTQKRDDRKDYYCPVCSQGRENIIHDPLLLFLPFLQSASAPELS